MDSKCSAFWQHTNVRGGNKVFPCCRFKTPVVSFNGNLEDILHSPEYQALRQASENGERIAGCEKCYYEEANGKESLRQRMNAEYDTDTVGLEFLEIGFDNICNLTCDGCWSEFSSEWARKETGVAKYTSVDEIDTVPATLKKVLFLGGEPLMTNRHEKFLRKINNPKLVEVIYNTNGTFLLKDNITELLKQFKEVTFILSIDAHGELNDKVRSGSNWNDILKFITQIKELGFNLEVNSVLHLNNWHGIVELEKFVKGIQVGWTVNVLTYPKHLDIVNYKNKNEIIELIKQTDIPNKQYVINHIS
jgi:sulfatase maturation enzyme AslB (radical SAM superfamily)